MRYFFNVVSESFQSDDPEGTDLPDDGAALIEAQIVIAELRRDHIGHFDRGAVLEVTQNGRRVFILPFDEVNRSNRQPMMS